MEINNWIVGFNNYEYNLVIYNLESHNRISINIFKDCNVVIAISTNETHIAVTSNVDVVIYDVVKWNISKKLVIKFKDDSKIAVMCYSKDDKHLAVMYSYPVKIIIWDIHNNSEIYRREVKNINTFSYSPDGQYFIIIDIDIIILDAKTYVEKYRIIIPIFYHILSTYFSTDSKYFAYVCDFKIIVLESRTWSTVAVISEIDVKIMKFVNFIDNSMLKKIYNNISMSQYNALKII